MSNDTLGHAADQPTLHPASSVRADDDQIDAVPLRVVANRLRRGVVCEHRDLNLDVGEVLMAQLCELGSMCGFIGRGSGLENSLGRNERLGVRDVDQRHFAAVGPRVLPDFG